MNKFLNYTFIAIVSFVVKIGTNERSSFNCFVPFLRWCPRDSQSFSDNNILSNLQFQRAARKSTSPVVRKVECIKSILIVRANLKCIAIRKLPVEVGRCFKRDMTAL